jgi:hypothetical protein
MSPHHQALPRLGRLLAWASLVAALAACRPPPPSFACAGACDAGTTDEWDRRTRRFAVVIGSNAGGPERKSLRYAEQDAARLASVLRELGSFRGVDVMLLQGQGLAAVRRALGNLRTQIQIARREEPASRSLALVYYSGHSDGRALELGRERLEFPEVQRALADSGAQTRLLIVDACQSGTMLAAKGGSPAPAFELDTGGSGAGEAILTSAAATEEALESAELQGSFFSHHLLSGLRGAADANGDGRVDLSEAYRYASARTVAETSATLYGAQHPSYRLRLAGQGDLPLTELPRSRASVEVVGALDRVVFIDAINGAMAGEWVGGGARRLSLTPGPYLVKAWRNGQVWKGRVTLGLGESRTVDPTRLEEAAAPVPAAPAALPPALPERTFQRTVSSDRECRFRCTLDPAADRSSCEGLLSVIYDEPPRMVAALELPSRHSLLRLRFQVCDPRGLWLNLADSPSCDGGGGDAAQFSNDAELELNNTGVWLFGNDYGRNADKATPLLGGTAAFVPATGCSVRTVVISDGSVRSVDPGLDVRSPFSLRLDPPADHEGKPDRVWYVGLNRSVGSNEPKRSGSGLSWVELCVQ